MNAMTEGPTSSGSDPSRRPRRDLRRSDDRRIAGVAAGVAETLDVDPTWVRLGFVISLLFTLGTTLLVYVVLWVVLPSSDGPSVVKGGKRENSVLLAVFGLAAIVILAGNITRFGFGPVGGGIVLPVLLIGAGVVMLSRRGVTITVSPADGAGPTVSVDDIRPAPGTDVEVAGEHLTPDDDEAVENGDSDASTPTPPGSEAPESSTPKPSPGKSKASSLITPIVFSLILISTGVGLALHLTDVVEVQLSFMAGVWLLLIAAGLLVSAFRGRAPGLIAFGVLGSLALMGAVVADPIIDDGSGERDYVVQSLVELSDEYRLGVGDLNVDLSALDLEGTVREIDIELSIGKLVVILPPGPALDLTIENDIGQISFDDRSEGLHERPDDNSGIRNEITVSDEEGDGLLIIRVQNNIGDVEVTRVAQ